MRRRRHFPPIHPGCDRVRPWQFRQCVGVFYSAGIGMCAMRQAPSMAGMRRIALWVAAAHPIIRGRWRCPVVASPQIKRPGAASCSPLEGDCRPSRAGMTEPGPQGPGFFTCKDHGRTPLDARSLAAESLGTHYRTRLPLPNCRRSARPVDVNHRHGRGEPAAVVTRAIPRRGFARRASPAKVGACGRAVAPRRGVSGASEGSGMPHRATRYAHSRSFSSPL